MAENELIFHFLRGLPIKIVTDIVTQNADKNLLDSMKVANRMAKCYFKTPKKFESSSNLRRFKDRDNPDQPWKSGNTDKNQYEEELNKPRTNGKKDKVICFNCKKLGHYKNECWMKKSNSNMAIKGDIPDDADEDDANEDDEEEPT